LESHQFRHASWRTWLAFKSTLSPVHWAASILAALLATTVLSVLPRPVDAAAGFTRAGNLPSLWPSAGDRLYDVGVGR
jgi:hypothetical protein